MRPHCWCWYLRTKPISKARISCPVWAVGRIMLLLSCFSFSSSPHNHDKMLKWPHINTSNSSIFNYFIDYILLCNDGAKTYLHMLILTPQRPLKTPAISNAKTWVADPCKSCKVKEVQTCSSNLGQDLSFLVTHSINHTFWRWTKLFGHYNIIYYIIYIFQEVYTVRVCLLFILVIGYYGSFESLQMTDTFRQSTRSRLSRSRH